MSKEMKRWQLRAIANKYRKLYEKIKPIYEEFDYLLSNDYSKEIDSLLEKLVDKLDTLIYNIDLDINNLDNEIMKGGK